MHLSEILTHLGEMREDYFRSVAPPVIQTSNFVFPDFASAKAGFRDELGQHVYTRGNNPTTEILRKKIAALEGAEDALVFGSGVAAISAAVLGNIRSGDHIVCVRSPYSWTHTLLTKYLPRFGVSHTFVDGREIERVREAIRPETAILFLESPNSMLIEIQDLEACGRLAREMGLVSIIDNSYASPLFQNPISLGIDLVVHTGTKYLNGHSDVVYGAVCGSGKMIRHLFETEFMTLGGILSPHDAAMAIRGLRTLELRMHRSDKSAMKIAEWLEEHPKVLRVNYPFARNYPQRELARKQMKGCGGLFSVILDAGSPRQMENFLQQLDRFLFAVSWGGYESLVIPMAAFYGIPGKPDPTLPFSLVRFYIGLEDPDWLIEDLEQALACL